MNAQSSKAATEKKLQESGSRGLLIRCHECQSCIVSVIKGWATYALMMQVQQQEATRFRSAAAAAAGAGSGLNESDRAYRQMVQDPSNTVHPMMRFYPLLVSTHTTEEGY